MSTPIQPEFDPVTFRFAAKQQGYSETEIEDYIRQRAPVEKPFLKKFMEDSNRQEAQFKSGLLGGLANTAQRVADLTEASASANLVPGIGAVGAVARKGEQFLRSKMPKQEELMAPAGQSKADQIADSISGFAGSVAGDLPVNMLIGGAVGKAAGAAAKAVTPNSFTQTLLTGSVPGSYFKSVAASMPINMAESVITDAIVHPEDVSTKEGVLRSAALGSLGALAQGIKGGAKAPMQGPQKFDPLGDILAGPKTPTTVSLTAKADQEIFDPARPFKDMENYQASYSPYSLARRVVGVEDQIHLNQNEVKMIPQTNGGYKRGASPTYKKLVADIANGAQDDRAVEVMKEWDKYVLGKSGYALAADANEVAAQVLDIEARYPHFAQMLPAYKQHTDELVDMMYGYGLIDADGRDVMKGSPLYVPTGRTLTNENKSANFLKSKVNTTSLREIKSPMQQLFEAERKIIQRGEANRLGNSIINELSWNPDRWKGQLEIVDSPKANAPIEAEMGKLAVNYKAQGLPVPTFKQLRAEAMLVSDELLDGSAGTLEVLRNGQPIQIRVSDPMITEFFKARKYVEPSAAGDAFRAAERFTTRTFFQPFRELTGKNAALDQMEAFFNTKWSEYVPGYDFVKGAWAQVKNDPRIQDIRAERGGVATRFADANFFENANQYEDFLKQATAETGIKAHLMHPLKAMHELMGVISASTRIGAGLRKMDALGGDAGDAANMARNVIADPQQRGTAQTIKLLANASFANYGLQSVRRTMQAAAENPGTFATKGLMTVGLPSIGLWLINKDDQEIQDLRKSKGGRNFWFVRNPQSQEIYALQKPYLQGQMFGTSVESALDGMDERAATELAKGLLDNIIPNPVPITVALGAELMFGKNFMGFMENPIPLAPSAAEGALPEDVAGNQTFGLSKLLAESSGFDAAKIDNTLKTIMFSQATDVYDRIDRKIFNRLAPETKFSAGSLIPTARKVSPNRSNVEPLNTFYEKYGELSKVGKSFEMAINSGNVMRMEVLKEQYPKEFALWQGYDAMNEVVGMINNQINMTTKNALLSPEDRRERIDNLRKMMISKVRAWNDIMKLQEKE